MSDSHPINGNEWSKAYPAPQERDPALGQISVEEVTHRMQRGEKQGLDFVIVDVRRTDCTALIPGAINLPAHSIYHAAPTLAVLLRQVPLLIFHCNRSNGRGPRAAGWFAEELQRQTDLTDEQVAKRVVILHGGVVAWEEAHGAGSLEERGNRRKYDDERLATVQL